MDGTDLGKLQGLIAAVKRWLPAAARPRVGLVLGSGLGAFADTLRGAVKIPYQELPGFPRSGVVGHAGNLVYGEAGQTLAAVAALQPKLGVLAMQGRVHGYEGHDLATVSLPIRVLVGCGCDIIILTNAAGGIKEGLHPGSLVLISDHLNLMGGSPLRGPNEGSLGPRFPDMSQVYDAELRALAQRAAHHLGRKLPTGVYAGCPGPQYETPAEVRMLQRLGADLVGMSTVPEAIVARHMGARVLGISCVTNLAAGISKEPLSHDEVTETADRVRGEFIELLDGILAEIAGLPPPAAGPGAHQGGGSQATAALSDARRAGLLQEARAAQQRAYAPYSRFPVGAAVLTSDGRVFTGANVENASYGLTLCAERNALAQAALAGARGVAAIAVVSPSDPPAAPCGMCRQTLAEFTLDCEVLLGDPSGAEHSRTTLSALLPRAFRPSDLGVS